MPAKKTRKSESKTKKKSTTITKRKTTKSKNIKTIVRPKTLHYTEDDIKAALVLVKDGWSYVRAAAAKNVPKSTLNDYAKNKSKFGVKPGNMPKLDSELEAALVQRLKTNVIAPKASYIKVKQVFQQVCQDSGIENPFKGNKDQQPSLSWIRRFFLRNPELLEAAKLEKVRSAKQPSEAEAKRNPELLEADKLKRGRTAKQTSTEAEVKRNSQLLEAGKLQRDRSAKQPSTETEAKRKRAPITITYIYPQTRKSTRVTRESASTSTTDIFENLEAEQVSGEHEASDVDMTDTEASSQQTRLPKADSKSQTDSTPAQSKTPRPKTLSYTEDDVKAALELVRDGWPVIKAAAAKNIPKSTLNDYVRNRSKFGVKPGSKPKLDSDLEAALVQRLKDDVIAPKAAYVKVKQVFEQVCKDCNIENPFKDNKNQQPSFSWIRRFYVRHPELLEAVKSERRRRIESILSTFKKKTAPMTIVYPPRSKTAKQTKEIASTSTTEVVETEQVSSEHQASDVEVTNTAQCSSQQSRHCDVNSPELLEMTVDCEEDEDTTQSQQDGHVVTSTKCQTKIATSATKQTTDTAQVATSNAGFKQMTTAQKVRALKAALNLVKQGMLCSDAAAKKRIPEMFLINYLARFWRNSHVEVKKKDKKSQTNIKLSKSPAANSTKSTPRRNTKETATVATATAATETVTTAVIRSTDTAIAETRTTATMTTATAATATAVTSESRATSSSAPSPQLDTMIVTTDPTLDITEIEIASCEIQIQTFSSDTATQDNTTKTHVASLDLTEIEIASSELQDKPVPTSSSEQATQVNMTKKRVASLDLTEIQIASSEPQDKPIPTSSSEQATQVNTTKKRVASLSSTSKKNVATPNKRNLPRKQYTLEDLKAALDLVRHEGWSLLKAAKAKNIPKSTLMDYASNRSKLGTKPGVKSKLDKHVEEALLLRLQSMGEVTRKQVAAVIAQYVPQLCQEKQIDNPFKDKPPTVSWLTRFLKNHRDQITLTRSCPEIYEPNLRLEGENSQNEEGQSDATPKQKIPRPKRMTYTEEDLKTALYLVKKGWPCSKAARHTNVPKSTLGDYVHNKSKLGVKPGVGLKLDAEFEQALVRKIQNLAGSGQKKITRAISKLVFEIYDKTGVNPFKDNRRGLPSPQWMFRFYKRHPELLQGNKYLV